MMSILQNFATSPDFNLLKIGKPKNSSTQKQCHYKLAAEEESEAEHGFVKNFIQLFTLQDRLRGVGSEVDKKGFSSRYPTLMGNTILNNTVYFKSAFFKS